MSDNNLLLEVKNLKKYFPVKTGVFARTSAYVKAVDDISFFVKKGETYGLVGESGCGKSTTSKLILMIEKPTAGSILFEGKNLSRFTQTDMQDYREGLQAVFQDPTASLNPRLKVSTIISEPMTVRHRLSKEEVNNRVSQALQQVGMRPEHARLFPTSSAAGRDRESPSLGRFRPIPS